MNNSTEPRPIPLLGDISLNAVQQVEHTLQTGFAPTRIAGLAGEVQQRSGRPSHRIAISTLLFGPEARDQLEQMQQAATQGEELTFSADITTALELQQVVITHFRAVETSGQPHLFHCEIQLAESPPLPPPAQIEGFGGLDDFGLGDLGFDTDILGDLQNLAGEVAGAVEGALDVIDQLDALSNLDGLGLDGVLAPMDQVVNGVSDAAARFQSATQSVLEAFVT